MATREFTGKHMLMIMVASFGTIIAVNLTLAYSAVKTFPGVEAKNSYVASQEFNTRRDAQEGLGWTVRADAAGGLVTVLIADANGDPVQVASLDATVGRATHVKDDLRPEFAFDGTAYVARAELASGNWNIRMTATAIDGTKFNQRVILHVKR